VRSAVTASVWKVLVEPGTTIRAGERVAILESMKMEIPVDSTSAGVVTRVLVRPGGLVQAGQIVAVLET
jgi:biotin carboxyl carrier protein